MLIETESGIILPGHPFFDQYLYSCLPFGWRDFAFKNPDFSFVARADSGILEPVLNEELDEYCYGGEYDELLTSRGEAEPENGYDY